MSNELTLQYLNQMYEIRERLAQFQNRKKRIQNKLQKLQSMVDTQLSRQQRELHEVVDAERREFEGVFKEHVDVNVKRVKRIAELQYNFEHMMRDIENERDADVGWLKGMTKTTIDDETTVHQKKEATRKILYSQLNFLKDRLKAEIEGRRVSDDDIWRALEQYKDMIQR